MPEIETLKQKILSDAKIEAAAILEEAQKQAEAIFEEAKTESEDKKQRLLQEAHKNAEEEYGKTVALGQMELRKSVLAAKQEAIDEAFDRAVEKIGRLSADEYSDLLVKLILRFLSTGHEEIILSKKDREKLGKEFESVINRRASEKFKNADIRISDETRDMAAGFVLRNGNIEVNYSFEDVINTKREEIEAEVAKLLFGGMG